MKDLIKEVALEGAEKFGVVADDSEIVDLVTWCLAELSKRAEDVVCWKDSEARNRVIFPPMKPEAGDDGWLTLFTFPPIHDITEIENRTAEACASVAKERKCYRASANTKNALDDVIEVFSSGEWRKYK